MQNKIERIVLICLILGQAAALAAEAAELRPPDLPEDVTVWPNRDSFRNSDPWLVEKHATIRKMQPRVLVLNFANDVTPDRIRTHAEGYARAVAEATRYHGFDAPTAPPFIEYQILRVVDLRDTTGEQVSKHVTSSRLPRKKDRRRYEALCDYAALFDDALAKDLGFPDPRQPGRFLNLRELVEFGFVHEMWFYAIHDGGDWPGRETCEQKQVYNETGQPLSGEHRQAGNSPDRSMPWLGRSFRVSFFNPHRGVGCALENFGHTLEWTATSGCVPYFSKYFREYAELNLDTRFGLPFDRLYRTDPRDKDSVAYPSSNTMVVKVRGKTHTVKDYVAIGGNVHFPPGARYHYDLTSPHEVLSTLEHYRRRDGPDGKDRATLFTKEKFARYNKVAPDCMGRWVVYWAQGMPGHGNPCTDNEGRPMKNWWPFLFY